MGRFHEHFVCQRCGAQKVHTRLFGYICPSVECQMIDMRPKNYKLFDRDAIQSLLEELREEDPEMLVDPADWPPHKLAAVFDERMEEDPEMPKKYHLSDLAALLPDPDRLTRKQTAQAEQWVVHTVKRIRDELTAAAMQGRSGAKIGLDDNRFYSMHHIRILEALLAKGFQIQVSGGFPFTWTVLLDNEGGSPDTIYVWTEQRQCTPMRLDEYKHWFAAHHQMSEANHE